ncbi:MAG: alpha/beta hydrolase-fold protein [Halopseudomonas sp.]|uniref:alpha/beta hydrolase n=1 Tax=Halopseudomonas sp. TaxID=2901191 RepID=UPI003001763F
MLSIPAVRTFNFMALALCLLVISSPAQASEQPVTLSGSIEWQMHNDQGHPYRILISKPEGDVPYTGGYPVLYVLDANAYFASFHEAKRAQKQFRHAIIVGIAYPGEEPLNFLRRAYDLSPPVPEERNDPPQGGQDELLDFLQQRVMPAVAERFPVDPDQQSLFGHSFGGMFAIHALFTRSALFDHVVAASPSLWWHDRHLLGPERAFSTAIQAGTIDVTHSSLALILGEYDSPQEIQDSQALHRRLQPLSAWGLRSSLHIETGEDHMSVPFRIESRVLQEVLTARRR